ncbi:hypothetical protein FLK61_35095 [Paenalkalicoccus suaedae]|uniref:Uncharacterized protein n=1 Tax=Paenalkalicoccus suaedae TaxID=2592382 RepID=A0A859FI72_9BACI|nr:hypothetical protein [Paenalkalicoccus suaedae]QKS71896.1 hypothetical protein FLK61_35095 [Paenalkalicoccus suaedae]
MFNPDSVVARTWAKAVKRGDKNEDDVPNLFNLRDIVITILNNEEDSDV